MKWINVKDRLPDFGCKYRYLFVNGKNEVTYGYAENIEDEERIWIHDLDRDTLEIGLYWMPLPLPPETPEE